MLVDRSLEILAVQQILKEAHLCRRWVRIVMRTTGAVLQLGYDTQRHAPADDPAWTEIPLTTAIKTRPWPRTRRAVAPACFRINVRPLMTQICSLNSRMQLAFFLCSVLACWVRLFPVRKLNQFGSRQSLIRPWTTHAVLHGLMCVDCYGIDALIRCRRARWLPLIFRSQTHSRRSWCALFSSLPPQTLLTVMFLSCTRPFHQPQVLDPETVEQRDAWMHALAAALAVAPEPADGGAAMHRGMSSSVTGGLIISGTPRQSCFRARHSDCSNKHFCWWFQCPRSHWRRMLLVPMSRSITSSALCQPPVPQQPICALLTSS